MKVVHIANKRKRDAQVVVRAQARRSGVKTVLPDGTEKTNARLVKYTVDDEYDMLLERCGGADEFEQCLVDSDPEVNMQQAGRRLRRTHKLYIDSRNLIAYRLNLTRVVYDPDGSERERHDINKLPANINVPQPLTWTGQYFARKEAIRRFVFSRSYQLCHINGVTFDFLYAMARELHEARRMVVVGAGKGGRDPILLTRGGQPYRGFLEGRAGPDRYALVLHLSDIELKAPVP